MCLPSRLRSALSATALVLSSCYSGELWRLVRFLLESNSLNFLPRKSDLGDETQTDYAYIMYLFRMKYAGVHNIADAAGLMGGPIARELAGAIFLLTWM